MAVYSLAEAFRLMEFQGGPCPPAAHRGFGGVEVIAIGLFVAAVTVVAAGQVYRRQLAQIAAIDAYFTTNAIVERRPLQKYGPRHFSRDIEEWAIRDFFQDRSGGIFLDVGANHYQLDSNTYFLETQLGWSGVAIDALPEFAEGYRQNRPRTRFVAMFASDVVGESVRFFVPTSGNKLVASLNEAFTASESSRSEVRQVPTTTLNVVLDQAGLAHIDFLSMDIELAEPKALAGFDIDRFQPALVCIEAHAEVRQQIVDYFVRHHYALVAKYLRADTQNLYFAPVAPKG